MFVSLTLQADFELFLMRRRNAFTFMTSSSTQIRTSILLYSASLSIQRGLVRARTTQGRHTAIYLSAISSFMPASLKSLLAEHDEELQRLYPLLLRVPNAERKLRLNRRS